MQPAIFITGATGFIGSHLVLRLLQTTDAEIYCLVRAKRESRDADSRARLLAAIEESAVVRGFGVNVTPVSGRRGSAEGGTREVARENAGRVHVVAGDLSLPALGVSEADVVALAGAGVGEVWHVASSLEYEEKARESLHRSNVDGTRALVELCATLGATALHYVSTAYVAGTRTGAIDETMPANIDDAAAFHNAYEQSKARAEHEVAARCRESGITYRIFRPSIVIGDSRTFRANSDMGLYGLLRRLNLFKARTDKKMPGFLAEKRLKVFGEGGIPIDLVPVDHAVDQMIALAKAPASEDGVFHIVNPSPPALQTVADVIAACLEVRAIDLTKNDDDFDMIDDAFRKSYDFYKSYFETPKSFDNANVVKILGAEVAGRRLVPETAIEKYVLAYVEEARGVEADRSVFGAFSRSVMTEKRTTSADGVELTYFDTLSEGTTEKPPLVLINAFGMDLEFWGPTVNFFKDRFRIVTWNLRGLPDASRFKNGADVSIDAHVADLRAILDAERIERAVVMGWCAGPKIALEFQKRHPRAVRALVLVTGKYDTEGNPDPETSSYSELFSELNKRIAESPFVAKLIVDSIFGSKAKTKTDEGSAANTILSACSPSIEYAPYAVAPFQTAENLQVYSRMSSSLVAHDVYAGLPAIDVPTLIIAAENDAIAHPCSSKRLAMHIETSELVVLPHASHFCLVESPGTFVHTIARYFEQKQLW